MTDIDALLTRMDVYAVLEKANGDFERRTNKGKRTAHDDRADDWKAAADAIAALTRELEEARREIILDFEMFLENQVMPSRHTLDGIIASIRAKRLSTAVASRDPSDKDSEG